MPRPEKVAAVTEIAERLEGAQAVFLAEYAGLSVKEQQELRRGLTAQGAEFKVLKMTLTRLAAASLEIGELDELLVGPTGIAFANGDPVSAAKVLKEFASSHDVFTVKGGLLGPEFLTAERVAALADIAPRETLLAMLAGAMKAPLTSMASVLAALPRGAATAMQQLLEKKEAGEFVDSTPDEEVADEAPAVEDSADEPEPESGDAESDDTDTAETPEAEAAAEDDASEDGAAEDVTAEDTPEEDSEDNDTADAAEEE